MEQYNQPRKYKSKILQDLYDTISKSFKEEGDCYDSMLKTIEEDGDAGHLPIQNISKVLIKTVLKDVVVDFYALDVEVLSEKEFLSKTLL
jgi:hypothetical protein